MKKIFMMANNFEIISFHLKFQGFKKNGCRWHSLWIRSLCKCHNCFIRHRTFVIFVIIIIKLLTERQEDGMG